MLERFDAGSEHPVFTHASPKPSSRLAGSLWDALKRLTEMRATCLAEFTVEAPRILQEALDVEAALLLARSSRSWQVLADASRTVHAFEALPPAALQDGEIRRYGDQVLVPIRPGRLALLLAGVGRDADASALRVLGAALDLALLAVERQEASRKNLEESSALQRVAMDILSVRDIDAVLNSITHTAMSLLSADISGVFLRDDDEVVMRCVVGNRSAETARVRMRAGKGLAGRVLETEQPVQVDNYVNATQISDDFAPLARTEGIRSALGAPLTVRGEIIGVLEVWRRRRSAFSEREVGRLVAMANLATIAIENARLYEAQLSGLHQLEGAYASLGDQMELLKQSSAMQRSLIQVLLDGEGLPTIARLVATQIGCKVAIMSNSLAVVVSYPRELEEAPLVRSELARLRRSPIAGVPARRQLGEGPLWMMAQPIRAAGESFGYACVLTDCEPDDALEIAIGQMALISALHQLERRAAEEARADARDELIWDLVQGSVEYRRAAANRAERMHIGLLRPMRIFRLQLLGLEALAASEGMNSPQMDGVRREIRTLVRESNAMHGGPDLVSLRGNTIVALTPSTDSADALELLNTTTGRLEGLLPGLKVVGGVSRPVNSPLQYGVAYEEASVALKAARRLGGEARAAVFDNLGIVRLLLTPGEGADLMEFVNEIIGPLLDYDQRRGAMLVRTLQAYLRADCSLNRAADELHIHHKTLRYRLDRMEELTTLDLRHNEDRFKADLALRLLDAAHVHSLPDAGG